MLHLFFFFSLLRLCLWHNIGTVHRELASLMLRTALLASLEVKITYNIDCSRWLANGCLFRTILFNSCIVLTLDPEAKKFGYLLILELFLLFDKVATHILLAETVDDSIDADRVNMGVSWLSLEHVLAEEVVFAGDYAIMLQVQYLLRKVFALSVWVQCKITWVESQVIKPLFRRKVLINGSEGAARTCRLEWVLRIWKSKYF